MLVEQFPSSLIIIIIILTIINSLIIPNVNGNHNYYYTSPSSTNSSIISNITTTPNSVLIDYVETKQTGYESTNHSNRNIWSILCSTYGERKKSTMTTSIATPRPLYSYLIPKRSKMFHRSGMITVSGDDGVDEPEQRPKRNTISHSYPWELTNFDSDVSSLSLGTQGYNSNGGSSTYGGGIYGGGGGGGGGRYNAANGYNYVTSNNYGTSSNGNGYGTFSGGGGVGNLPYGTVYGGGPNYGAIVPNYTMSNVNGNANQQAANGGQQFGTFNQFGQQMNPFQTNRLDFAGHPGFLGFNGINGQTPIFLVSKNMGFTSWLIPFIILLALPFIISAAFIPLFLKSVVYLLQIGRNLGILFPLIPPVINGTVTG
ncbi:hypothetical protein RDWZM_010120 [Blomia tropicalis]|uniref:Uncharacterized protein n=1 Tax=Blomia tropicalis TaxID=40697 RepID=A0A9Q0RIR4_BLOTA|nr:hypothetical protein RDWZM_010120 [Blomia tropicalis]